MRSCRITALLVAAASVTPCLLLLILGSRRPSQLRVREGYGAHNGRDNAEVELAEQRRVWLYSVVGTDFPGDTYILLAPRCCHKCCHLCSHPCAIVSKV